MPYIDLSQYQQLAVINLVSDLGHIKGKEAWILPDGIRVTLQWSLSSGNFAHCVLYGRAQTAFVPTVTVADAIFTGLTTGAGYGLLKGFMPSSAAFSKVILRDMRAIDQPDIESDMSAVPGTGTGAPLPDEVALAVTLRTAKVGQGNRGRFYLGAWGTTALGTGNEVADGAVTAAQSFANDIFSVFAAQSLPWVLGLPHRAAYTSPKTGAPIPERPAVCLTVTQHIVRDKHWDSQRRRGLK